MAKRRLPYAEGTWFAVPLTTGGYALGILARSTGYGLAFGYFFGPRHVDVPTIEVTSGLDPNNAILATLFGDLGLLEGKWPIVGRLSEWNREDWPVPELSRIDDTSERAVRVKYSDTLHMLFESPCSLEEAKKLPAERTSGYGAVEIRLTMLLKQPT